eukprot:TRINITY_DN10263_c0_g1_i1.p1 TRINITY_DN10263_c0_g1~~TRINITY_DN10263_c0_g1_i1.p1  ORF type:complete len:744 (-),score=154.17 TRINITY_DN10263_c0_g1_i1:61-2292(-)
MLLSLMIPLTFCVLFTSVIYPVRSQDPTDFNDNEASSDQIFGTLPPPPELVLTCNYSGFNVDPALHIIHQALRNLRENIELTADEKSANVALLSDIPTALSMLGLPGVTDLLLHPAKLQEQLQNISDKVHAVLQQYQSRLEDLKDQKEAVEKDFHDTKDALDVSDQSFIRQIVLQSKISSLMLRRAQLDGLLIAFDYIKTTALNYIIKLGVTVAAPPTMSDPLHILLESCDATSIKKDLAAVLNLRSLVEKIQKEVSHAKTETQSHIEEAQQQVKTSVADVPVKFADVKKHIEEKKEEVSDEIRDTFIAACRDAYDAMVNVTVGPDTVTITIHLSLNGQTPDEIIISLIRGSVALVSGTSPQNIRIEPPPRKRNNLMYLATILNNYVDLSTPLPGTDNLNLPPPPTQEQIDQITTKYINEFQHWYSDVVSSSNLQSILNDLNGKLNENEMKVKEFENESENETKGFEEGRHRFEDEVNKTRNLVNIVNIDAAVAVLKIRQLKLMNSIAQFRSLLSQKHFNLVTTRSTVLKFQIRVVELIINGTISVNKTLSLLQEAYIRLKALNETIQHLEDQKNQLLEDLQHLITEWKTKTENIIQKIKPKLIEIKNQINNNKPQFLNTIVSSVKDFIENSEIESNETQDVDRSGNSIGLKFRIIVPLLVEDLIIKVFKNVIAASSGAPADNVAIYVTPSKKRSSGAAVEAVITVNDATAPTNPPTAPPNTAMGLSATLSLVMLALFYTLFM